MGYLLSVVLDVDNLIAYPISFSPTRYLTHKLYTTFLAMGLTKVRFYDYVFQTISNPISEGTPMRSSRIGIPGIFVAVLVFTFLSPINVFAKSPFYITLKPGIYSPQSSDLEHFDAGFNGEIGFGYRFSRNFAAELGIGYFNTDGEDTVGGITQEGREFYNYVYPVTLTLKAILPYKKWEFFGFGGAGAYIVSGAFDNDDYDYHHHHDDYDDEDDYDYDVRLGGYLGAGIHYNITRRIFVGVEGRYLWMDKVRLDFEEFGEPLRVKFSMDGIIATAVLGIKF